MFGGLLKDEEQKSLQGIWGLTDIPILGKLFGNNCKKRAKTDVILTIRAVLVRRPDLGEEDFEAFDPDLATSQAGPFVPEGARRQPAQDRPPAMPGRGVKPPGSACRQPTPERQPAGVRLRHAAPRPRAARGRCGPGCRPWTGTARTSCSS